MPKTTTDPSEWVWALEDDDDDDLREQLRRGGVRPTVAAPAGRGRLHR